MKYHYFYRFFTYSVKRRAGFAPLDSGIKRGIAGRQGPLGVPTALRAQSALKTVSGGEFDWGGTSVKR